MGGFGLCVLLDRQRHGALRNDQCDPVSDAQLFCPSNKLLQCTLGVGARMVGEVLVLLGDMRLERGQFRVPGVSDCLGTPRIPPPHVADTVLREHLGQLLIEEVHWQDPGAQQLFHLRLRHRGNIRTPLLGEVCALLPFHHATVTNAGHCLDTKPGVDLVDLCRQGVRIWGITRKHCDRDGMAVLVAE